MLGIIRSWISQLCSCNACFGKLSCTCAARAKQRLTCRASASKKPIEQLNRLWKKPNVLKTHSAPSIFKFCPDCTIHIVDSRPMLKYCNLQSRLVNRKLVTSCLDKKDRERIPYGVSEQYVLGSL